MQQFPHPEPDNRTETEKEEDREWDELLDSPHPDLIEQESKQFRLREKLRAMNFDSVTAFLAAHPSSSYYDLSKSFGSSVPLINLHRQHALEAVKSDKTREYAIDMLIRELRYTLPDGWIQRKEQPLVLKTVHAIATLTGDLRMAGATQSDRDSADRAWKALLELDPPLGWLPRNADDPLIQRAFEIGWPFPAGDSSRISKHKE